METVKSIKTKDSEFLLRIKLTPSNLEISSLFINSEVNIEALNFKLPKLKYLSFVANKNIAQLSIDDPDLNTIFKKFMELYLEKIDPDQNLEYQLQLLKTVIKDFLKLAEKDKKKSPNAIKGFYSELLKLKELLESETDHDKVIGGWHRPTMANHDFSYDKKIFEIKSIALQNTTVRITSEYQLWSPEEKELYLEIYRLETIPNANIDSVGILYNEICLMINNSSIVDEFVYKCQEDEINYCGPSIHTLDYHFILQDKTAYFVDQITFPRVRPNEQEGISKISYDLSLDSIETFKITEDV